MGTGPSEVVGGGGVQAVGWHTCIHHLLVQLNELSYLGQKTYSETSISFTAFIYEGSFSSVEFFDRILHCYKQAVDDLCFFSGILLYL